MDSSTPSPLRVFVVDESTLVRERLVQHIGPTGAAHIVGEAEDVETALRGIEETDAEAVILDLRLIDSNGMDLLHALRNRTDPIVTIVLTNYASPVFREASVVAGADFFFDKTTEFDLAMETIARLAREKIDGAA
ncbi:response regulator [Trinickia acidisoli]|uniref:response regulator n=1 Tax=Trinickia acidisoli TaxID=2767482 RepID=UPI001A8CDF97|nr:response regulator [Trinickia acidisoli]